MQDLTLCFALFILAGGPLVESTHGNLKYTAPLTGITAAVVGVILNLAAFFAYHVFWPQGFAGCFDVIAALIGFAALLALLRYKVGVIPVIVACRSWTFIHFLQTLACPGRNSPMNTIRW